MNVHNPLSNKHRGYGEYIYIYIVRRGYGDIYIYIVRGFDQPYRFFGALRQQKKKAVN